MKHADVRSLLGDYLEGDLPLEQRGDLESHLAGCPTCSEELRGLRGTVSLLRRLPDPELPPGFAEAVLARIEAGEGRPRLLSGGFRHTAARRLLSGGFRHTAARRLLSGGFRHTAARRLLSGGFRHTAARRLLSGGFRHAAAPALATALAAGIAGVALLGSPSLELFVAQTPAVEPLAQAAPGVARSGSDAGDAARRSRRPVPAGVSSAAEALGSPFAGVAPIARTFEGVEIDFGRARERDLDRQLDLLARDPAAFLDRMGPSRSDRFAQLARRAARRGRADEIAKRLIATPHPLADHLMSRFLAASLQEPYRQSVAPE